MYLQLQSKKKEWKLHLFRLTFAWRGLKVWQVKEGIWQVTTRMNCSLSTKFSIRIICSRLKHYISTHSFKVLLT